MLAVEIMNYSIFKFVRVSFRKFYVVKLTMIPLFCAYLMSSNISGWSYNVCTELALSMPHITQIHLKKIHIM